MLSKRLTNRSPWWDIAFDVLLIAVLIFAVFGQYQIRTEIHSRQRAAYNNCVGSNDARRVVVNLLLAAKAATLAQPDMPEKQRQQALDFYNTQISQIKYADCTVYKNS